MTKRRFIAPLVVLFLCIGLVSVGFAAWVITTGSEDTFSEGQFTVYKVENKSIQISTALGTDNTVNFGASAKDSAATNSWLTFTEGTPEDLTFSLEISITNWEQLKGGNSSISLDVGALAINVSEFNNNNYITTPAAGTISITKANGSWSHTKPNATGWTDVVFDSTTGKVTISYKFGWGSEFGNENPITYYNRQAYTVSLAEKASTALGEIFELNGKTNAYSITVKANIQ